MWTQLGLTWIYNLSSLIVLSTPPIILCSARRLYFYRFSLGVTRNCFGSVSFRYLCSVHFVRYRHSRQTSPLVTLKRVRTVKRIPPSVDWERKTFWQKIFFLFCSSVRHNVYLILSTSIWCLIGVHR